MRRPESVGAVIAGLQAHHYLAGPALGTAVFLSLKLERPLFLEGEPGVGKTALAQALAQMLHVPLIRLQCYEGIDRESALYEWNYPRQLLHIRLRELSGEDPQFTEQSLYREEFLLKRPLYEAIRPEGDPPVLLIDEIDRSDDEFEAFLLEVLSEFQISIPEIGTLKATQRPVVILTSNRTRDVHDALKRRCLYQWLDYPSYAREREILRERMPQMDPSLSTQIVHFVQNLRQRPLEKVPGLAETLDWAAALEALGVLALSEQVVEQTLGCVLKYRDDIMSMAAPEVVSQILGEIAAGGG